MRCTGLFNPVQTWTDFDADTPPVPSVAMPLQRGTAGEGALMRRSEITGIQLPDSRERGRRSGCRERGQANCFYLPAMRTTWILLVMMVAAACGPVRLAAAAGPQLDEAAIHALFINEMPAALSAHRMPTDVGGLKLQKDTLAPLVAAARPGLQGMRPNQGKGLALRRSFTDHTALALGAGMGAYYGGPDVRFTLALQYGF